MSLGPLVMGGWAVGGRWTNARPGRVSHPHLPCSSPEGGSREAKLLTRREDVMSGEAANRGSFEPAYFGLKSHSLSGLTGSD